jgi:hypothetical protein
VDTHKAAVARAAELAGGVRALSVRLRIPVVDLMRWIQGEKKPPIGVFLRIVDFLLERGGKPGFPPERERRKTPRPPKV